MAACDVDKLAEALSKLGVDASDDLYIETIKKDFEDYIVVTSRRTGAQVSVKTENVSTINFLNVIADPVIRPDRDDILTKLINAGADPSARDDIALKAALMRKDLHLTRFLLEAIKTVDDKFINEILDMNDLFLTKFILERKVLTRAHFFNVLLNKNYKILDLFLSVDSSKYSDPLKDVSKFDPYLRQQAELIKMRLEIRKANLVNLDEYKALIFVMEEMGEDEGVMRYLISKGADVRANDDEALVLACGSGNENMMKFLISNGANPAVVWGNEYCRKIIKRIVPKLKESDFKISDYGKYVKFS